MFDSTYCFVGATLFHSHHVAYTLFLQAGDDYVGRQDQLNRRAANGRGRGKGRGRGRGAGHTDQHDKPTCDDPKSVEESKDGHSKKKRKIATPQASKASYEEFWTEEMWEEWNKWKGGDQWNEEWNDDDWRVDWGQPGQAFDRYAVLDGQVSLSKMKEGNSEQASTQANKKKHGNDSKKISEKAAKKSKPTPETEANDDSGDTADDDDDEVPPIDEKQQVNDLAKYLRECTPKERNIKGDGQLTEDMKDSFKKNFAPTSECRFAYYWKRPAVGVFLKAEKRDFGCFSVPAEHGPFGLRLCASLKAAGMLATRNKKQNISR